jgi:hypothetical protein
MGKRALWVTPELVTLSSGFEMAPPGNPKTQWFEEGSRACPPGGEPSEDNSGCPGGPEGEIIGPS